MNREEFLEQPNVAGFVNWFGENLDNQVFHLNMRPSRYIPGGLKAVVTGLPNVLRHYTWQASWKNPDTQHPVVSLNWQTTKESLGLLRQWLTEALAGNDQKNAFNACREVLRWGGVRGAIPFLTRLMEQNNLIGYLNNLAPLMQLDCNPSQSQQDLNTAKVLRFDAGLTKIHALIDKSGSPIYDSRVGAAMAMFYALYRSQNAHVGQDSLQFPTGTARGKQIRNPGELEMGYPNSPQFYTRQVRHQDWARWQLRLGWILRAVLEKNNWFANEGDLAARCHAFEACLFMVGYDLRCFNAGNGDGVVALGSNGDNVRKHGWVPTGHTFSTTIVHYLQYRRETQDEDPSKAGFSLWMVANKSIPQTTANANCFPFSENEFDLFGRGIDLATLEIVAKGGHAGLCAALRLENNEPYEAPDDRSEVCLVNAWIVGCLNQLGLNAQTCGDILIEAKFAGTLNTANLLRTGGRNVGRHFGLLEDNNAPTPFYTAFFRDEMDDLNQELLDAMERMRLRGYKF